MRLSFDQIEKASIIGAQAFQNDPIFVYYYPNSEERHSRAILQCEYAILLGILSGEVHVSSNNLEGFAIWFPKGVEDYDLANQSKVIVGRIRKVKRKLFSDPVFLEKYILTTDLYFLFQEKHANFPHWRLEMLAIDPTHQKEGFGSILLKTKLKYLDTQNLPCYLETHNKDNVAYYTNFGFELVGTEKIPDSNLTCYGLLRK